MRPFVTTALNRAARMRYPLMDLDAWTHGSLTLMSEPQIRVREERAGAVIFRLEPLPDGNPTRALGPPRAGAPRAAASTTVRRYSVQKVTLQFNWGDEQPVGPSLVVGTDSSGP